MILVQIIASFLGTAGFSVLFNVPKKEVFFCGTVGALGWVVYTLLHNSYSVEISSMIACILITVLSRFLANLRKMPFSVFTISGILPIAPGGYIYDTMYLLFLNKHQESILKLIDSLKLAGSIAIAILFVLSIPGKWFNIKIK